MSTNEIKELLKGKHFASRMAFAKTAVEPNVNLKQDLYGIKETKDVFDFGFDLSSAINESLEDGKINLLDAPNFFKVVGSGVSAINGIKNVKRELLNLTSNERRELEEHAINRLGVTVTNEELLDILAESINIGLSAFVLSDKIVGYKKRNETA